MAFQSRQQLKFHKSIYMVHSKHYKPSTEIEKSQPIAT